MPTYHQDSGEVARVIEDIASRYHQPLVDAGVTFDALLALPKDSDGTDLVKHHGRECYAVVSITSYKLRCRGLSDVTLLVDGIKWQALSERERMALIDHELQHVELKTRVVTGDEGDQRTVVARDDLDRPKLKLRPHDWEIGGFDLIVARYGADALELQACRDMVRGPVRQSLLPFMGDVAEDDSNDDHQADFRREAFNALVDAGVSVIDARSGEVMTNAPGVTKRRAPRKQKGVPA